MRITSGLCGGRKVSVPKGTRPTQDRVREAFEGVFVEGNRQLQTYCEHDLEALGYDL